MSNYVRAEDLSDLSVVAPELLDWIEFAFEGVTVRVRGVLHGLTGGANREYLDLVERSINDARRSGIVMAEKSMRAMYRARIDKELDDWLVFRPGDAFRLGAKLFFTPSLLWMLVVGGFKERLTTRDEFDAGGRDDPDLLGGSPLFHRLEPSERRALAGFPGTLACVRRHLALRIGVPPGPDGRAEVPGKHWRHLNVIEQQSLIPIRSVHMLHYAVTYARRKGVPLVNVFVGEMHNSDMAVLARNWSALDAEDGPIADALRHLARTASRAAGGRMGMLEHTFRYLAYIGSLAAPLFIAGAIGVTAMAVCGSLLPN
ncbi:hypothetical protein G6L37_01130 [Agrobacterium rubi]|nr:hypothetical protein [Agrobacterium rubi]NTF23994.1 hypothetical protein [Agrobacterium rubi]